MISFRFFVGIQVWAQLIPEPWEPREENRVTISINPSDTIEKDFYIASEKQHKLSA